MSFIRNILDIMINGYAQITEHRNQILLAIIICDAFCLSFCSLYLRRGRPDRSCNHIQNNL